jgi:deaminated glutathione amidase
MLKLALAQMAHPADGDVIAAARTWAKRAANEGAKLLVFPEFMMTPFEKTPEEYSALAQPLDGEFTNAMNSIARETGLWIVYSMNEKNTDGDSDGTSGGSSTIAQQAQQTQPYNTIVVVDSNGVIQGSYRKTHLYAAHGSDEHEKVSEGNKFFTPIKTPFCTLGLGVCYDLRFPEHARSAALGGCDLLIYDFAWFAGPHKAHHWNTLLAARAIENEFFVVGCDRPDANCIGHSTVVDPLGEVVAQAGEDEELLFAEIDMEQVKSARQNMPSLEHRRPELYSSLVK